MINKTIYNNKIQWGIIMDKEANQEIYFYYSEEAAQQFGYSTAILKSGEKLNFTCQSENEFSKMYGWKDKQELGPINKSDIEKWEFKKFLNPESQLRYQMDKNLQDRMYDEAMRHSELNGPGRYTY